MDRTGDIRLRDFDTGIMGLVGATLRNVSGFKSAYWAPIQDIEFEKGANQVRCLFVPAEQVIKKYILPSIVVRRPSMPLGTTRMHSGGRQYRTPAKNASPVIIDRGGGYTAEGYTAYESKLPAVPYDFNYEIQAISRYENDASLIFNYLLYKIKNRCIVTVTDSIGDERKYPGYTEDILHIGEIQDVLQKRFMVSFMIVVQGQLDQNLPTTSPACQDTQFNMEILE